MNRVERIFRDLRSDRRRALMPFVCGGYPDLRTTSAVLPALEAAGASIVEIGFPFSDPIADGPVIAAAMHSALQSGVTPRKLFDAIADVRGKSGLGLIAMVSVSIVHRMGAAAFARDASEAGVDGVILPDVPLEEAPRLLEPFRTAGLTTSLLVAPTTPVRRLAAIAGLCTGFVYLMARLGITGTGGQVDGAGIRERVRQLRDETDLPVACGFGVSTPEHVRAVVAEAQGGADAAIVGSALVSRMGAGPDPVGEAARIVSSLAAGLR